MADYIKRVLTQIGEFIKLQSPGKKLAMAATAAGIVVGIGALFMWAGDKTYTNLMANLNAEDSASVIRVLRDKHIPFRIDQTGKNISVPPENVDQLRLELATAGLPQSGTVGYEVFDKQSLGTTSFVQKINQKRALEGEITRTISTIKGVRHARVHLAMPTKSTFVEDQKKSTASVALDLEPGTQLSDKQVYGISNLVARAVEGMDVADVVIVDSNGKVLSKNASDPLSAATASQLEFQQKIENDYEHSIEQILSRVVGEGHVVAKVTADLDFAQVNETSTTYDQDGSAVRSVEKHSDSMHGSRPGPVGPAGSASNQAGQPPATNSVNQDTNKDNELTNYEVPQTVRRTMKPMGTVKRLSVAVLVDGKQVKTTKDGVVQSKVESWSPEKLKEFEDIVASTVGIDKKRGDSLEIRTEEFTREDFDEAARLMAEKEHREYVVHMATLGAIGILILSFFFFVVRPFIKWITENTIESVDSFLPQTIEELERLQKNAQLPGMEESLPILPEKIDPEKVEGEMIKEKIITLVDSNPHKAALILKDWLHVEVKKDQAPGGPSVGAGAGGKGKSA